MRIKIPFHDRFVIEIASGRKTMTTRSRRCGKIGDVFYVRKMRCRLLGMERMKLGDIVKKFCREEGFKNPKEFKEFWLTIHRRWQPERKFYLHVFERDKRFSLIKS